MKKTIWVLALLISLSIISAQPSNEYLCNKTFEGIMKNQTNQQIVNEILNEKNYGVSDSEIENYKNNWENLCQDVILRTLNPEELCQKIYYFILSNNYNYTQEDFKKLADDSNFSVNILKEYRYNSLCENNLPKQELPILYIYPKSKCELDLPLLFKLSFFFPDISVGELKCKNSKVLNYIFELESYEENYQIKKIRIWWLFVLVLLSVCTKIIISASKTDKMIDSLDSNLYK